jgi:hypothetical protein
MAWRRWVGAGVVVAAAAGGFALAQPEKEAMDGQAQAMAQMNRMRPEHKQLAEMCGVFDVTLTIWPAPGAAPMEIKGVSTREMVLNGQFMQERLEVTGGPMPFSGLSFMGFNADAKDGPRFEVVRMSTTVNTQMPEAGTFDPATKTFTLKGQHEVNGMYGRIRNEINVGDMDRQVVETWLGFEGYSEQFKGMVVPESKGMKMEYVRRK